MTLGLSIALLGLFALIPSVLAAFNLYPTSVTLQKGTRIAGNVYSLYYPEPYRDAYKVHGTGFIIYDLQFYVSFANNNPNDLDPELGIVIAFTGGGNVRIKVTYYEGGTSTFYLTATGDYVMKWYDLTDTKTVQKVEFYNLEWWFPGKVYVDMCILYYG